MQKVISEPTAAIPGNLMDSRVAFMRELNSEIVNIERMDAARKRCAEPWASGAGQVLAQAKVDHLEQWMCEMSGLPWMSQNFYVFPGNFILPDHTVSFESNYAEAVVSNATSAMDAIADAGIEELGGCGHESVSIVF